MQTSWNQYNWQQIPRSTRIDSSAGIRGLLYDGMFIDEVRHYPAILHDDIIDAEWRDVGVEMRVARWNTVWADIAEAYYKKVHCIES